MPAARTRWRRFFASAKPGGPPGLLGAVVMMSMVVPPKSARQGSAGLGLLCAGLGRGAEHPARRADVAAAGEEVVGLAHRLADAGRLVAQLLPGLAAVRAAVHAQDADRAGGQAL